MSIHSMDAFLKYTGDVLSVILDCFFVFASCHVRCGFDICWNAMHMKMVHHNKKNSEQCLICE